jgi:alkylation response protein AidB-like acyl-CoA dehydrogenase
LSGRKIWISNGCHADLALVVARTGDGGDAPLSRFLVDREPAGFQSREIETIGLRGFSTAELVFDDTLVPKANLIGRAGDGLADSLIDFGATRCYAAIGAVGVARAALEAAVAYARQRVQWGQPIAGHQLIQAHIAQMATQLDCARLLTLRAADLIDRGMRCDAETSMAKYFATEAAVRITSAAIQVHGAIGLSAELPVERYFRDARMMTIPDGTSEIQKLIIARDILGVAAFGESSAGREGDPK